MAHDFVSNEPNAELTRKIQSADNAEALREILKSDLAQRGVLVREQDGSYAPAQTVSPTTVREDAFAEPGTPRFTQGMYIELRADSPEQLAEMKRKFYEKFGRNREGLV